MAKRLIDCAKSHAFSDYHTPLFAVYINYMMLEVINYLIFTWNYSRLFSIGLPVNTVTKSTSNIPRPNPASFKAYGIPVR